MNGKQDNMQFADGEAEDLIRFNEMLNGIGDALGGDGGVPLGV